jgi:Tol biopolymer transport system component
LALGAGLLPSQGYADLRGAYAPITLGSGFVNGTEQPAHRPIDADGLMQIPFQAGDPTLIEEWVTFSNRSLIPGHETCRSIYLHYNSQQSAYWAPLRTDPAAEISYFDPAWSSDGRFLAYCQVNLDGSNQALYVQEFVVNDDFSSEANPDGFYPPGEGASDPVGSPILVYSGSGRHPDWQPGTHTLAFDSSEAGTPDIYTIDVDTDMGTVSNLTRRTFDNVKAEQNPAWAPNGHEIAYATNRFGPNILEIIDLNLVSTAPGYMRSAEVNFNSSVSHNDPDYTSDGNTLYYDAPSGEDPNGLTTIWNLNLTTQAKCEINLDQSLADADPNVSGVVAYTSDHIPFNYFLFTSQAAGFGLLTWRGNPITACQLPLKMGVATVPSVMDLNDSTTTTFRTVMNFPPETRDIGFRCASGNAGGKDGVRLRNSILASPTLLGLATPVGSGVVGTTCFDSTAHGLTDSLRIRCDWDFRDIADRIVALGLVGQIVPMKMTAYSNITGRTFQGFAYMKLTQSSLPAAGVALLGNSPNPFNPVTKIRFAVSKPGTYTLRLYNVQGALVKTVASGHYDVGVHEATWDGRTNLGGKAASGVYYAKMSGSAKEGSSRLSLVLAK